MNKDRIETGIILFLFYTWYNFILDKKYVSINLLMKLSFKFIIYRIYFEILRSVSIKPLDTYDFYFECKANCLESIDVNGLINLSKFCQTCNPFEN